MWRSPKKESFQPLNGNHAIDAGTRDEFALDVGARILSKKLADFDVPHVREEFDDGHFSISYRYERSLELISETILHHRDTAGTEV